MLGRTPKTRFTVLKCNRCGYEWLPKTQELPKFCAQCNSPYWNTPRKNKIKNPKGIDNAI